MARSRNIKPGFFKNEVLGEADPIYSLLFAGLWVLADREGRLENRPKRIRAEIFPYRFDVDVSMALAWLKHESFITVYELGDKSYIQINKWRRHQTPHHKEVESEIPPMPSNYKELENQEVGHACAKHESTMDQARPKQIASCPTDSLNLIPDSLNSDSLHTAPSSADADSAPAKKSASKPVMESPVMFSLPTNTGDLWPVHQKMLDEWSSLYPAVDILQQLRAMYGWLDANPSKRKTKQGIKRFIVNWLSREQDKGGSTISRMPGRNGAGNRQEALEQRNHAAGDEWLRGTEKEVANG